MKLNHPKSQQVIDETFAMYKDGGNCPPVLRGKTILHLYPAEDTFDKDGNLNGYYQCRFFNLVVFNIHGKSMKRYDVGKQDAIYTMKANISNLSVFKDGAFCIMLEGDHRFLDGQAPSFWAETLTRN